jgi:transcriptional regulator with XRE-family HTH domain
MHLIGNRIRALRRQRGLSQEQLGELVGFSQSKISKIERGERGERGDWDSLSDLRLIAKVLGVKLKELIDDEPDGGGSDEKEDAVADERS